MPACSTEQKGKKAMGAEMKIIHPKNTWFVKLADGRTIVVKGTHEQIESEWNRNRNWLCYWKAEFFVLG